METTNAAPAPAPEKKSLFETIVTSTPVLLAVIATFILGQSSSEMTKAQYQRAVASQNQSKVGDQWAFFQAKRIRGTSYEMASDLLAVQKTEPFTRESLLDAGEDLVQLCQRIEGQASNPLSGQVQAIQKKAEQSLARMRVALDPPPKGWKGKRMELNQANVTAAFAALEHYPDTKFDPIAKSDFDADQLEKLNAILDDIRKFKPESDIAPKTLAIKPETLEKAMETAKANAADVNERGKKIERVLEEFDILIAEEVAIARELQRAVSAFLAAQRKGSVPSAKEDQPKIFALRQISDRVGQASARLRADYKSARHAFTAHRYEDDARSNQDAAYLYDVQVLQSSARSDRHLSRSFGFMIAMLVAQIGVTIAALAVSLKRRLPVWAIATLSGIAALAFAAYVFLELGPLM